MGNGELPVEIAARSGRVEVLKLFVNYATGTDLQSKIRNECFRVGVRVYAIESSVLGYFW